MNQAGNNAMPTFMDIESQYRRAAQLRDQIDIDGDYSDASEVIGEYRELSPCPKKGKITFKQIGDLREYKSKPVSMDDETLLICRKPVATGDLDGLNKPIYRHAEPTFDPVDFYQAFWGHEYDIYRGRVLPINPIGAWNENFSNPQPQDNDREENGYNYRGGQVKDDDEGEYFSLYSSSRYERYLYGYNGNVPIYRNRYFPLGTFAISAIGRVEAGTRLVWKAEVYKAKGEKAYIQIGGWSEGFFGGESKTYHEEGFIRAGSSSQWETFTGEFTVDDRFMDLYISFQQNGNDNDDNYERLNFRNVQIWRA